MERLVVGIQAGANQPVDPVRPFGERDYVFRGAVIALDFAVRRY
jgi:hypothetical protein